LSLTAFAAAAGINRCWDITTLPEEAEVMKLNAHVLAAACFAGFLAVTPRYRQTPGI
jgi:hypothetical protein